jgi:hypothetical protein
VRAVAEVCPAESLLGLLSTLVHCAGSEKRFLRDLAVAAAVVTSEAMVRASPPTLTSAQKLLTEATLDKNPLSAVAAAKALSGLVATTVANKITSPGRTRDEISAADQEFVLSALVLASSKNMDVRRFAAAITKRVARGTGSANPVALVERIEALAGKDMSVLRRACAIASVGRPATASAAQGPKRGMSFRDHIATLRRKQQQDETGSEGPPLRGTPSRSSSANGSPATPRRGLAHSPIATETIHSRSASPITLTASASSSTSSRTVSVSVERPKFPIAHDSASFEETAVSTPSTVTEAAPRSWPKDLGCTPVAKRTRAQRALQDVTPSATVGI